jgi:hypothetical protein
MKRARGVALINIFDHPKNDYSAFWEIARPIPDPDGSGKWVWRARLHSYAPIAWEWGGQRYSERPDVQAPTFPPDLPFGLPAGDKAGNHAGAIAVAAAIGVDPFSMTVAQLAEARVRACERAHAQAPKPVTLLDEATDVVDSEEDAHIAAQSWVASRIENYRRSVPLKDYSDAEVEAMVQLFDASRQAKDFARVDRIRGLLKSRGVVLDEQPNIDHDGKTAWRRQ